MEVLMRATAEFAEDVVPLGDLKIDLRKAARRADEAGYLLLECVGRGR